MSTLIFPNAPLTVSDVRRIPPLKKGMIAGIPIQSYDDLNARLDMTFSSPRGWPKDEDEKALVPQFKERLRTLAESTLLRSFLDFNEGRDWTQRMMPRSGRWKIAYPVIGDDGRVFMRKVPTSWHGAAEVENFERLMSERPHEIPYPEHSLIEDEETGIYYIDMLYVTPLSTSESRRYFEEHGGRPDWAHDIREFGLDSNGDIVSFDPDGLM